MCTACAADEEGPPDESATDDAAIVAPDAGLTDAGSSVDAALPDAQRPTLDAAPSADAMGDAATAPDAAVAPIDARTNDVDAAPDAARDAASEAGVAQVGDAGTRDAGAPPFAQAFHIALRVHREQSGLPGSALASVLEEVNQIWWRQAAICFEIEVVRSAAVRQDGFDLWFHRSGLGCGATGNGVYCGDHDIHSLDMPSLGAVNDPAWDSRQNAARTTAHELGHGLSLDHYNGFPDSNDSLMSSGRQGFKLHESEISAARTRARAKALANSSAQPCAPVPVTE
ncbi:MAG TPA: hypothetical protein VFZ61_11965 [Polyangiales bacterium]